MNSGDRCKRAYRQATAPKVAVNLGVLQAEPGRPEQAAASRQAIDFGHTDDSGHAFR